MTICGRSSSLLTPRRKENASPPAWVRRPGFTPWSPTALPGRGDRSMADQRRLDGPATLFALGYADDAVDILVDPAGRADEQAGANRSKASWRTAIIISSPTRPSRKMAASRAFAEWLDGPATLFALGYADDAVDILVDPAGRADEQQMVESVMADGHHYIVANQAEPENGGIKGFRDPGYFRRC
jgi:hypothetical protein